MDRAAVRGGAAVPRLPTPEPARLHGDGAGAAGRVHRARQATAVVGRHPVGGHGAAGAPQRPAAAQGGADASVPEGVPAHAARDVRHRARGARGGHRVVGRRTLHRQARLVEAAQRQGAAAHGRRAGVPRRPLRRAVRDGRRFRHHASARRHAARDLGFPEAQGLLLDDHPEEVRRPRVLGLRALLRARQTLDPQRHGVLDGRRAELARPRRAAAALRYRGAEGSLPSAARARR